MTAKSTTTTSGDGERRAQQGYIPQYDLAARILYGALSDGSLDWVGLADRKAGSFDDLVIGKADGIIQGYQLKTIAEPKKFRIKTLLLGGERLLRRLIEFRTNLRSDYPDALIEICYATDDFPDAVAQKGSPEKIGPGGQGGTSARFLTLHQQLGETAQIQNWKDAGFGKFVQELQANSGLDEREFLEFFGRVKFLHSGFAASLGFHPKRGFDADKLSQLAAKLPRLITESRAKDRWTRKELLDAMGWRDTFQLHFNHEFPLDAHIQKNAHTESALCDALATYQSGYLALIGQPGTGKSTLLQTSLLSVSDAIVVRYLAFVPGQGQGLGRGEGASFLHDLLVELKNRGLGSQINAAENINELRRQFEDMLAEAGQKYLQENQRTVVVVDGLDHVPREEKTERSLLSELPLPDAIPEGVIFVLGTQRLDLPDMPPQVSDMARADGRRVDIHPLPKAALFDWSSEVGLPDDVDRDRLYDRTRGHPLSVRYELSALTACKNEEERKNWLGKEPEYEGDIDRYYRRIWNGLEGEQEAREALAFLALAECPLHPNVIDSLVGEKGTEAVWKHARHVLGNEKGSWSIVHNSLRLFLRSMSALRFGTRDEARTKARYRRMAEVCTTAEQGDPMRWMALRYLARAEEWEKVAELATPDRFRAEFLEGRRPADTSDDMRLCFMAAKHREDHLLVVALLLAQNEINQRCECINDDWLQGLIALDDLEGARAALDNGVTTVVAPFTLVDALLERGDRAAARSVFERFEPLEKLHGQKLQGGKTDEEVDAWARCALAFRSIEQFLDQLQRLRVETSDFHALSITDVREALKLQAAVGEIRRTPNLDVDELVQQLGLEANHRASFHCMAAEELFPSGDEGASASHVSLAAESAGNLHDLDRLRLSTLALRFGDVDAAYKLFDGLFPDGYLIYSDDIGSSYDLEVGPVFQLARVRAQLGLPELAGPRPRKSIHASLQHHLERLGRIKGRALRASPVADEPDRTISQFLMFLGHALSHNDDWRQVNSVAPILIRCILNTAKDIGRQQFDSVLTELRSHLDKPGPWHTGPIRREIARWVHRTTGDALDALTLLCLGDEFPESTPEEQTSEAAKMAEALVELGYSDKARQHLHVVMRWHSWGYARAPKKDALYVLWEECFEHANQCGSQDRPERLRTMGRLLSGLHLTEGHAAGERIAGTFLAAAASEGVNWTKAGVALFDRAYLGGWHKRVLSIVLGVARQHPEMLHACVLVYCRLGLPWSGGTEDRPFRDFVDLGTGTQLQAILNLSLEAIQVDSPNGSKVLHLRDIFASADETGVKLEQSIIDRWEDETAIDTYRFSREETALDTLAELESAMQRDDFKNWDAERAFVRLATNQPYDVLADFLTCHPTIEDRDRVSLAMTRAAHRSGNVTAYNERMKALDKEAESGFSWNSWRDGGLALEHQRILIDVHGEPARKSAFDRFCDALATGKEGGNWFLADLCEVIATVCANPSWPEIWKVVEAQLHHSRDYMLGEPCDAATSSDRRPEVTLSYVLAEAMNVGDWRLTEQALVLACELTHLDEGAAITAHALEELLNRDEDLRLLALQIGRQTIEKPEIQKVLSRHLDVLLTDEDYGVRSKAEGIARRLGRPVDPPYLPLSASYQLLLPENPELDDFRPPSGISTTGQGIWTTSGLDWTYALETPLDIAEQASGISLATLRLRVIHKMQLMGGEEAFGTLAHERQLSKFRRLEVHGSSFKIIARFAFKAFREVVAELVAANHIDPEALPILLYLSGVTSDTVSFQQPSIRPTGVEAPVFPDRFSSERANEWLNSPDTDLLAPEIEGFHCLAATANFERCDFHTVKTVERYHGPANGEPSESLWEQLEELPSKLVGNKISASYRGIAEGGLAIVRLQDIGGRFGHVPVLCPNLGSVIGWAADLQNSFRWLDGEGQVAAETLIWRDGGFRSEQAENSHRGEGAILAVRDDQMSIVQSYTTVCPKQIAWRHSEDEAGKQTAKATGHF